MRKLIPIVLMLAGICGGIGAGLLLRPDTALPGNSNDANLEDASGDGPAVVSQDKVETSDIRKRVGDHDRDHEYIKLNNQFIIPIVAEDSVEALILMSLSLEVTPGHSEFIYQREPKLRDVFLQVMFDHANMGGFRGTFTDTEKLDSLRRSFLDVAQAVLGPVVSGVLITDITRQKA